MGYSHLTGRKGFRLSSISLVVKNLREKLQRKPRDYGSLRKPSRDTIGVISALKQMVEIFTVSVLRRNNLFQCFSLCKGKI